MNRYRYLAAGLLTGALALATAGRAAAQVTIGPAGVQVSNRSGNSVVIPYGQDRGLTLTTPNMAIDTTSGNVYPSIFRSPNGTTTYLNPSTGNYFNPVVGEIATPPFAYPGTFTNQRPPAAAPYTPGGQLRTAPVIRPTTPVPILVR